MGSRDLASSAMQPPIVWLHLLNARPITPPKHSMRKGMQMAMGGRFMGDEETKRNICKNQHSFFGNHRLRGSTSVLSVRVGVPFLWEGWCRREQCWPAPWCCWC